MENSEQIKEWAKGYGKKLHEQVKSPSKEHAEIGQTLTNNFAEGIIKGLRPKTTQAVIDGFSKLLDAQDDKGIKKYGTTIDEAEDAEYDWRIMALEETADLQKYLVKEIKRLENSVKAHEEVGQWYHQEIVELVREIEKWKDKKVKIEKERDEARQGCEKYRKDNKQLKEELEKRSHAIIENCDLRVKIEDLKITNEKLMNRANSWERVANGNYKAVVKVEKERDEFKKQYIKAHAEIQDLQYQKKILAEQLTLATSGEKKTHDCSKNQAIHWQGKDIVKVKCLICDKTLYQA
jgi:chromosome segregation ATPase